MTAQSSQIKAKMFEIWLMRKIMMFLLNSSKAESHHSHGWELADAFQHLPGSAIETMHDYEHPPRFQNEKNTPCF